MHTIFEKETEEKPLTALAYGQQIKIFRQVIYSKYITYAQEAHEQIDGSILKEIFLACFIRMNTGLRPLFNTKPCIRFHIESI